MKVICEKCSASYDIENERIPAEGMTMKCPKCLGSFQVKPPDDGAGAPVAPAADPDAKYFIRRHTGSVFGPFAQSAILTMATDGKLDGSEDLSPDKVDWSRIASHPAFAQIFDASSMEDLPAPAPKQPPRLGGTKPVAPTTSPAPPADLPTATAVQPTKMGMPSVEPPVAPTASPAAPADLPTPVADAKPGGRPAAPRAAITPPAPEMPDLPTPVANAGPAGKPAAPRAAITPPAPDMPELPTPTKAGMGPVKKPAAPRAAITPPAPDMPDLPTPVAGAGPAGKPRPATLTPPPPEMPDMPPPMVTSGAGSTPELPTPVGPPATSRGLPDLPTPKKAAPTTGEPGGIPDLPAPKDAKKAMPGTPIEMPELPTPIGGPPAPHAPQQSNLPTPIGGPPAPDAPQQPDLPTPIDQGPGVDPSMSYGEVDLLTPLGDDSSVPGGAPLDLSELDLVTPKDEPASAGPGADEPPDLSELDLVAPKEGSAPLSAAPQTDDARGDAPDLQELDASASPASKSAPTRPRPGPRPTPASGDRLLGLPKMLALGIIVGVVVIGAGIAVYKFLPRGAKGDTKSATSSNTNHNVAPVQPRPSGKTRVTYAPAMDLDTHKGYLTADKTYFKKFKKTGSSSLKAARAKARFCDAYRFGVRGKRLAKASKLLAGGDAEDVEQRKAKALSYLLKGKLKKARGQLKKARASAKKDPEIYVFLGWVELQAGRKEKAEKAFRRAIKYRGESAAALFGLSQSLRGNPAPGKEAERQRLLRRVVKLSPRHVEARVALLSAEPGKEAHASIKALEDLSSSLGDDAAPQERAILSLGLANLHRRAGELDLALTLLGQAAKQAPKQVQVLRWRAEALLEAGDGEGAASQFKAALKQSPHDAAILEGLVRAHILRGQPLAAKDAILAFSEQQPQATKKKATKEEKKEEKKDRKKRRRRRKPSKDGAQPDNKAPAATVSPYLSLARGRVALAQGKPTEAKNLLLESTAQTPRFTPGHVAYLELMLRQKQLEGAKSVLELIKRKYDTLPAALLEMEGRLLLARSKPSKAEKAFRAALAIEPHNNRILIHLALCLWQHLNKPEEGYLLLQKVFKRAKSLTRVVFLLAEYHWKSGDRDRAFARFRAALKVNSSLTLKRRYAEFLLRIPNPVNLARAEKLLQPILKDNPRDHGVTALYALVELGKGNPKKAMMRIKRAVARSPKNVSYLVIKARIAEATGRAREALSIYEDLLASQPKQRRIMLLRARLLCRNRATKPCLKAAGRILKVFGDPEGFVLQGQAYLQKRKPGRAMRAFKKAIAKNKHYAEAYFLLGRTLYHDAAFRKALSSLIRCLELADETRRWWPDIHYFLGISYVKVHNKRLAAKHLKKYLATKGNPDNVETSEQQRTAKSTLKKL